MFMKIAFQKAGMGESLHAVVNGREAIDYLAGSGIYADRSQHPLPAVVLLDLNLPVIPGFDVLRWLRSRPELAGMPVVVFSSSTRDEDKAKARELGAKDFVGKPQTMGGFGEVVERVREKWLAGD